MTNSTTALALAAGGGRGAYQAGALLYLAESGVRFGAVAGSSVGSLNGAFYAQGDGSAGHLQGLVELWRRLPEVGLLRVSGELVRNALTTLLAAEIPALMGFLTEWAGGSFEILDPGPVATLLDQSLSYSRICDSPIDLTTAVLQEIHPLFDALSGSWRRATYLQARDLGPEKLRSALLAATAIPLIFPSYEVGGSPFTGAMLADTLPARVLYERGARQIVSIFLADSTLQNRSDFPGAWLLQIRPSVRIDHGLASAFDFSKATIDKLLELGYTDASEQLSEASEMWQSIQDLQASGNRIEHLADSLPDRNDKRR